jgi:thiol-disulfide isomerase/thioredoxin
VDAAAQLAIGTARLDDSPVRIILGAASLILAYWLVVSAKADELVTLESLRWKHRVLLLDTKESPSDRPDWSAYSSALSERNLFLFRKGDDGYLQQFPKSSRRVRLRLAPEIARRAGGRVTLIGKDGRVKGEWTSETADLPAVVFRLVDRMPMRQREIRESEAAGGDLLGTQAQEWLAGPEWANSKPLRLDDLRGRVVVVRFWTDTCPYCEASLPAMQKLAEEMKDAPVTFVGLYQSKPLGSERPWKGVVTHASKLGVAFPIAYDHHWATLRSWWLDGTRRRATSASFVIDPYGRFVHVHPGPVFFPSEDPADARANDDFEGIRDAILRHLPDANR